MAKLIIILATLLALCSCGCGGGTSIPDKPGKHQVWFYTPDVEAINLRLESLGDAPERAQLEAILAGGVIWSAVPRRDLDTSKWYIDGVTFQ